MKRIKVYRCFVLAAEFTTAKMEKTPLIIPSFYRAIISSCLFSFNIIINFTATLGYSIHARIYNNQSG